MLEPRRQRLQSAEITPLYSSLGDKSQTLSPKKREKMIESIVIKNLIAKIKKAKR